MGNWHAHSVCARQWEHLTCEPPQWPFQTHLPKYRAQRSSVRTAAQAVGISPAQYKALEQGTPQRQAPTGDTPAPGR